MKSALVPISMARRFLCRYGRQMLTPMPIYGNKDTPVNLVETWNARCSLVFTDGSSIEYSDVYRAACTLHEKERYEWLLR